MKMIRGILTGLTEGEIKLFSGTGRAGETFTKREFWQHYGFTSRPLDRSEAIILKDGNVVNVIASDDRRYRLAIEEGEVALYSDEGDKVHFKRGKEIEINSGGKVVVDAPQIDLTGETTINGNLHVVGNITATGTIVDTGGNTPNHSHS